MRQERRDAVPPQRDNFWEMERANRERSASRQHGRDRPRERSTCRGSTPPWREERRGRQRSATLQERRTRSRTADNPQQNRSHGQGKGAHWLNSGHQQRQQQQGKGAAWLNRCYQQQQQYDQQNYQQNYPQRQDQNRQTPSGLFIISSHIISTTSAMPLSSTWLAIKCLMTAGTEMLTARGPTCSRNFLLTLSITINRPGREEIANFISTDTPSVWDSENQGR